MNQKNTDIVISWHRLPPYAAHLIDTGIHSIDFPVDIVASKPLNLVSEVEEIISKPIYWVDSDSDCSWDSLGLTVPKLYFQSGWLSQAFRQLGTEVKQAGGKVVCFSDNSWKNTPRQWLGSLGFRLRYRKQFDAVWVPGQSGVNLMNFYGMPKARVYQGMYGSNPEVFKAGTSLENRPKKFLFVGQLIERKGVHTLIKAFKKFQQQFSDWTLHIIGSGPLHLPSDDPNIHCESFSSPRRVAEAMRDSRFLILPSIEDHWGLVVHEGACSGCGLIVSKAVGAALDLVNKDNGIQCLPKSVDSLHEALVISATKSTAQLKLTYDTSLHLAKRFGTHTWPQIFQSIINDLE